MGPRLTPPPGALVVVVVGSRSWPDPARVERWVAQLAEKHPDAIVASGRAPGVDFVAEVAAGRAGLRFVGLQPRPLLACLEDPPARPIPPTLDDDDPPYDRPELAEWRRRLEVWQAERRRLGALYGVMLLERTPDGGDEWTHLPGEYATRSQANHARNRMLAQLGHEIVAFQYRGSAGTESTLEAARALAKTPTVYPAE